MKTLIAYYSRTGNTQKICEELHSRYPDTTDIVRIEDDRPRGTLSLIFRLIPKAIKRKPSPIKPLDLDMSRYDRIVLASPIWASSVPPAIYGFVTAYDINGKNAAGIAVSAGNKPYYTEAVRAALAYGGAVCLECCHVCDDNKPEITL